MSLARILERSDIWRGGTEAISHAPHAATGQPELDVRLGGGWPLGSLTELLLDQTGIGELRLLLPALAALPAGRWQAWVDPPHVPYAPALAAAGLDLGRLLWVRTGRSGDGLWALEQALRSGACGAVLGWPARADTRALRRLQLAAEATGALAFLYRPRHEARQPSPAALRLELTPARDGLTVQVLKRRGGRGGPPLVLAA
jgi:hypothetical protein